jgi:hypothetical protein
MKIIHTTSRFTEFGPVHFEQPEDPVEDADIFLLTVAGTPIAELAPLNLPPGCILDLGADQEAALIRAGCWSLDLIDSDGRPCGTQVLCVSSQCQSGARTLTGELAVWATLSIVWTRSAHTCGRG